MEGVDWLKIAKFAFTIAAAAFALYKLIGLARVKKGVLLIDRATKAARRGRMQQALALYEQGVAEETPGMEKEDIHFCFANECHKAGMHDKAVALAQRGIECKPGIAKGYMLLGNLYFHQHEYLQAEDAFRTAARLEPANIDAWASLGTVQVMRNRPAEALPYYFKALELSKDKAVPYGNLTMAYARMRDVANAEKYLKLAKKAGYDSTKTLERELSEARSELARIDGELRESGLNHQELMSRLESLKQESARPCLKLIPSKQRCHAKDSRFAGRPWLPQGFSVPLDADGHAMRLLAQINFGQMPALEGFPRKGILQFYIAENDLMGLDFDHPTAQRGFQVVYHEDDSRMESIVLSEGTTRSEHFPIERELRLSFEPDVQTVSSEDHRFGGWFEKHVGVALHELPDSVSDSISELFEDSGHRLGGYPMFTQSDPRENDATYEKYDVLLLQIDSDDSAGIMWGDCGVANFFISSEDLAACRFDDVLYNWDCC